MHFKALVCWLLFLNVAVTLQISSDTLDELETLIKSYKALSSKKFEKKDRITTTKNEHLPRKVTVNDNCAENARVAFRVCIEQSEKVKEKRTCAELFYESYTGCYFNKHTDAATCFDSCLSESDRCVVHSDRVEDFVCIQARKKCTWDCKSIGKVSKNDPIRNVKKEDTPCRPDCEADFRLCHDGAETLPHGYICSLNNARCIHQCMLQGE